MQQNTRNYSDVIRKLVGNSKLAPLSAPLPHASSRFTQHFKLWTDACHSLLSANSSLDFDSSTWRALSTRKNREKWRSDAPLSREQHFRFHSTKLFIFYFTTFFYIRSTSGAHRWPRVVLCVCLCFILLFYDLHNDYSLHSFGAFFFFFFFFFSFLLPVLKGCRKDAEHSEHLRLKVAPYIKLVVLRGALLIIHDNRRNMFF